MVNCLSPLAARTLNPVPSGGTPWTSMDGDDYHRLDQIAHGIIARMTADKLALGTIFLAFEQRRLWAVGGHDSFEQWLLTLQVSRSTAYTWMDAARATERLTRPDPATPDAPAPPPLATAEDLMAIGVSNLAQLGKALHGASREDAEEMVTQARELTTTDFKRAVRERKGMAYSQRDEFLEDTALTLRDLAASVVTSPDPSTILRSIEERAHDAQVVLVELTRVPTDEPEAVLS